MFDALGEFVFKVALLSSIAFLIPITFLLRFVLKRGWFSSILIGTILGSLIGFFASPHIFLLYVSLRGYSF